MKHAELEETLRATLAGRAETVTRGPDWRVPAVSPPSARRRTARWLAPLAAAAAVAAVVLSVVAIEHRSGSRHIPPASHHPSHTVTNSSPTTTSTAPPPAPLACRAALPTEWAQAIHSSLVDVGGTTAMPLSVTPGGGILVARDFGPIPGSARDIVLVQRGAAPAILYRVANPDALSVAAAQESGHWLVVALRAANDRTKGEVPGSSATGLQQIVIVDLLTGAHHSVGSVQDSRGRSTTAITTMAVLNGKVYWDEEPRYGSATGTVYAYDLASGSTSVAYHGRIGYPVTSAGGFGWGGAHGYRIYVPVPVPAPVLSATDAVSRTTLDTDGTSWAWVAGAHEIGWWRPGLTAPTYVRIDGMPLTGPHFFPTLAVVSGRFVFPANDQNTVVDVQAGAVASIPSYRRDTRGSTALLSGPFGTLVGEVEFGAAGHFVQGYWQDRPLRALRLDTRGLPGLAC